MVSLNFDPDFDIEPGVAKTLSPLIRRVLAEQSIQLINYRHLGELAVDLPA